MYTLSVFNKKYIISFQLWLFLLAIAIVMIIFMAYAMIQTFGIIVSIIFIDEICEKNTRSLVEYMNR